MESVKIAIVLGSKFPTKKAYGITTRFTLKTLLDNRYNAKVYANQSCYIDDDFLSVLPNIVNLRTNYFISTLTKYGENGKSKKHQIFWFLGQIFQIFMNLNVILAHKPDLVWVRDPWIAALFARKSSSFKIVLEVHGKNHKLLYKYLNRYQTNITFLPINGSNYDFLDSIIPNTRIKIAPMGIDRRNLASASDIRQFARKISKSRNYCLKIGYFGKLAPQGYSKGVEDLILLGILFQNNSLSHEITLIGHIGSELENLKSQMGATIADAKNVKFIPHVSHTTALKMMKSFDILILPLPVSSNYQGMPIKLMEYLASGRISIVAASDYITKIFNGEFCPYFYKQGNIKSLFDTINDAISDSNLEEHLLKGVDFASKFTWESRTKSIMAFLLN